MSIYKNKYNVLIEYHIHVYACSFKICPIKWARYVIWDERKHSIYRLSYNGRLNRKLIYYNIYVAIKSKTFLQLINFFYYLNLTYRLSKCTVTFSRTYQISRQQPNEGLARHKTLRRFRWQNIEKHTPGVVQTLPATVATPLAPTSGRRISAQGRPVPGRLIALSDPSLAPSPMTGNEYRNWKYRN